MISSLHLLRALVPAVILMVAPALCTNAAAEESDARQQKIQTAMVYNFARFTSWPDSQSKKSIVLCVSQDTPLYGSLMMLDGREIEQRNLRTTWLTPATMEGCDIAYLSRSDARADIANKLAASGVLTISDDRGFARKGMIEFVKIGRQVRFEVNNSLAKAAGVNLSSKLLRIAVEVH